MGCDGGKELACVMAAEAEAGYGDPAETKSGDVDLVSTRWEAVLSTSRPAVVILLNTSAVQVQWTASDNTARNASAIGGRIPAAVPITLDKFKGRIYCRSSAGAASVNFIVLPRH